LFHPSPPERWQVYVYDARVGGTNYLEYYSGIMSWGVANTNSNRANEVPLHHAGHYYSSAVRLQTQRNLGASGLHLELQIASDTATASSPCRYRFQVRQLIGATLDDGACN
jgi:hypothetical protein